MSVVRNVIFDLGGVLLEWNPDEILFRFQPDSDLRRSLRRDLFCHPDWRMFWHIYAKPEELH